MNLTNTTDIPQAHTGAFNDFWSFMGKLIFNGIPLFLLYTMGYIAFVAGIIFQPILVMALVTRPNTTNSTSDLDEQIDNQSSMCGPYVGSARFLNRAFGGKNDLPYITARTLGYIGGFAAGGHIINNMNNNDSPEFVVKSVLIFDGITFASAMAGNYVLGKTLDICVNSKRRPQILNRFEDLRDSELLNASVVQEDESDELMPIRHRLNDLEEGLESSTLSSGSTNTLILNQ